MKATDAEQFAGLAGEAPAFLEPVRAEAFERFRALGFPTTRHEDWRFTSVAPLARQSFRLARPDGALRREALPAGALVGDWPRLVFVDGRYVPELSDPAGLPDGVTAGSLAQLAAAKPDLLEPHLARHARFQEQTFTAWNTAFLTDGACLIIPDGCTVETPIQIVLVACPSADGEPSVTHPRSLVVVGRNAQATVLESHVATGAGAYLTNAVTELVVGDGAHLDHYKLQREAVEAFHVGATEIRQGRDSTVRSHIASLGGRLVRNNITTVLDGEGSHCALRGLYVIGGRQHVDNHLRVEHASPHCDSREYFKGVLDGSSRAVFTGRIVVDPVAQKTDAKQSNMNLLLSPDALVDTKPQLEIFADDVKCTHGATIGQLDDEAIFYLRARGVSEAAARALLVYAFCAESIEMIRPEPLRRLLAGLVLDRLPQGRQLQGVL